MNKSEFIDFIAKKTGLPKIKAQAALDAVVEGVTSTLKKGGQVTIVGFGTFKVARRAATEGRNPRTGAKIKIPARKQPKFSAGKQLKEAVNK